MPEMTPEMKQIDLKFLRWSTRHDAPPPKKFYRAYDRCKKLKLIREDSWNHEYWLTRKGKAAIATPAEVKP